MRRRIKLLESASAFDTAEQWKEHAASYEEELKARSRANSKSQEGVTLSTMHSAKGLEYPVVFVTDVNEGVIPHHKAAQPADLEEERRLFYVALTRAKDRLHLFAVKERYHRKQEPSRFLRSVWNEGGSGTGSRRTGSHLLRRWEGKDQRRAGARAESRRAGQKSPDRPFFKE